MDAAQEDRMRPDTRSTEDRARLPRRWPAARQRFAARIAAHGRNVDPAAKRRWNQAYGWFATA